MDVFPVPLPQCCPQQRLHLLLGSNFHQVAFNGVIQCKYTQSLLHYSSDVVWKNETAGFGMGVSDKAEKS